MCHKNDINYLPSGPGTATIKLRFIWSAKVDVAINCKCIDNTFLKFILKT